MLSENLQLLFGTCSLLLIAFIVYLIQKKHIELRHSGIWLIVGFVGLLFSWQPQLLIDFGQALGFAVPSNAIMSLSICGLGFLLFLQNISLSQTKRDLRRLAQKIAKDEMK